ncbi:MAG: demethoxyubiquinone hydroxylase family protein [Wolbachia endosymbiont of Meromenopon meropis]|nr:demethoxyubiquinone hydroxylase family protein [Wolbachia endosymbiont of Meromenopon meropis]
MQRKKNLNKLQYDKNRFLQQVIRVNHAGEYGAICIYYGQKLILKRSSLIKEITAMEEQEKKHFNYFNEKIKNQKIRPTILLPVWCIFGVSLGIATAIIGRKATMACTAAIEEVIGEHYKEQILNLENEELIETISEFCIEELKHRDIAIKHNAEDLFSYKIFSSFIKRSCKVAIYLSKLI